MRIVAIAVTAILLGAAFLAFGRYDYVQRGSEAVRVDRITGRTAVLRPVQGGGAVWATLKTPADVANEKARCAERTLPDSQRDLVSVAPVGRYVHVRNASTWTVRDIEATVGGAQTVLRRVDDSPRLDPNDPLNEYALRLPPVIQVAPGYEADYAPTTGVVTGAVSVIRVSGVPSDCH